ncbi:MAG TPA: hypothetical protein VK524_24570, partial [Polyangiaceae bacterium]|nr:hypothetical protein [Polyangiaceae bacterium]
GDPAERIRRCVAEAFKVYEATPESKRGLDPMRSIQDLVMAVMSLMGVYGRTGESARIAELAELIENMRPLSPGVALMADIIAATARAMRGQTANHLKRKVLEQVAGDIFGMDETARLTADLIMRYYLALEDVLSGVETPLDRLAPLDAHAAYKALYHQVRMLMALAEGRQRRAENFRRMRDLAVTGGLPVDRHLDTSAHYETLLYVALGDLSALRLILPTLKERSTRFHHWKIDHYLALATCHALRGDLVKAVHDYEAGLLLLAGTAHACWAPLVVGLVRTLVKLGRAEQACQTAQQALAECAHSSLLPVQIERLEMALALAEARVGRAGVRERAAAVIERAEAQGRMGVFLLDLLVQHAQIGAAIGDRETFAAAAERVRVACAELGREPFAAGRSAELEFLESSAFRRASQPPRRHAELEGLSTTFVERMRTEFGRCHDLAERAELALQVVLEYSPAAEAFLYVNEPAGPKLAAAFGAVPPSALEQHVQNFARSFFDDARTVTLNVAVPAVTTLDSNFELIPITAQQGDEPMMVAVAVVIHGRSFRPIPQAALSLLGIGLLKDGSATDAPSTGR